MAKRTIAQARAGLKTFQAKQKLGIPKAKAPAVKKTAAVKPVKMLKMKKSKY